MGMNCFSCWLASQPAGYFWRFEAAEEMKKLGFSAHKV